MIDLNLWRKPNWPLLPFLLSNGTVGGDQQTLNQLKSSPDSDPINVSLQRPHYYRHKCRHHHHDYHHYHTIWLNVAIIIIWRPWSYQLLPWTQSPSYLQSFPKNVTLYFVKVIKVNFELVGWKKRVKKFIYTIPWCEAKREKTGPFLLCLTNYWCQEMFYEGNKCFSFSTQYLWNWVVGVDKTTTTRKIKGIIIFFW